MRTRVCARPDAGLQEEAVAAEGGNMTRAAARLGLERSHLHKKPKKLGGRKP